MEPFLYVPCLKGKAGELDALSRTTASVKKDMRPLIELPPIPPKYLDGEDDPVPAKSITSHIEPMADRLASAWGESPLFVDGFFLEEEDALDDGREPMAAILDDCRDKSLAAIPVVGIDRVAPYIEAVREAVKKDGNSFAIRLTSRDMDDLPDVADEVPRLLEHFEAKPEDVDLIVDMGPVDSRVSGVLTAALPPILAALPSMERWRSLTLLGGAFPTDLSEVPQHSIQHIERVEWEVWLNLRRRQGKLPRMPLFGDYAIAHPELVDVDPRLMRMSPNLRYTAEDHWVVAKGEAFKRKSDRGKSTPASVQIPKIAASLVREPAWCGEDFSYGDEFIAGCAAGTAGPGNATTWRAVGTNHHLAFVVQQLSNLRAS